MGVIRSVLWIGDARDFPAGPLTAVPTLDVVWERDVSNLRTLSAGFDIVVLDAVSADAAVRDLALLRDALPQIPVLARIDARYSNRRDEIASAGAASVVLRFEAQNAADGTAEIIDLLITRGDANAIRSTLPPLRSNAGHTALSALVGQSAAMREVRHSIERAARSRATVLISGETGTGKELAARAIHRCSARRAGPLVAFNCAAVPETLLESELLGHTRGAFTGAERERKGLIEEAHGGTLFLDEVGEASPLLQAKLLRVVQERTVRRIGASAERRVDARIVAATNRDLWGEVAAGRFREDLYYRLAVFPITMPPLRDRTDDIPELLAHFLARHGPLENRPKCTLSAEALHKLEAHNWPGNIRELENEIQRALVLAEPGAALEPSHFSDRLGGIIDIVEVATRELRSGETLRETLERIEAWLIRRSLEANQQRRTQTARVLGITREGLHKKMKRLNIV